MCEVPNSMNRVDCDGVGDNDGFFEIKIGVKMKTREEVAEFLNNQIITCEDIPTEVKYAWHYGRMELRDLMDFIYENKPTKDEELIT